MHSDTQAANDQARSPSAAFVEADLKHVAHPMTRLHGRAASDVLMLESGEGIWLRDADGNRYLDAIAGLVNVSLGYGQEEIADAAASALTELSYGTLFFGRSHQHVATLAERLSHITPAGIDRFFFTTGGSDALDSAVKIVRFGYSATGRPEKSKVIGRAASYHGLTVAGMSATGQAPFWKHFGSPVDGFVHVDQPSPKGAGEALAQLEARIREEDPETVAAFIAEPVSLPSAINVPDEAYWPGVRELCDRYDILLIADEVVCGFGRTGRWFGMDNWDVAPDLMMMSKAINNGAIPMGAVGMTEAVYARLPVEDAPFLHGFTAGGHPVACKTALASLDIMERDGLVDRAAVTGVRFKAELERVAAGSDMLGDVRALGMLVAFDVTPDPTGKPAGTRFMEILAERERMLVRDYGDSVLIAPALVVTDDDVDEIIARVARAASALSAERNH